MTIMLCTTHHRDMPLGDQPASWTHIAPRGEFPGPISIPAGYDVPGYGVAGEDMEVAGLTVIDDAALHSITQTFRGDILIDADHLSHDMANPTEAMGWGKSLRPSADGDGLELETEWTPPGREKILTKVYRKISPEFSGHVRFEGGTFRFHPTSLTGAGLTNRPNIQALRPVSANRTTPAPPMKNALPLLLSILALPEGASEQEIETAAAAHQKDVEDARKLKTENDRLEAENQKLRTAQVDGDMERYQDVIDDPESTRELLQLNRAATVKILAARQAKAGSEPSKPPLYQRHRATPPDGEKFSSAAEADQRADQAKAYVATVRNREKCSFEAAWQIAKSEKPELFA